MRINDFLSLSKAASDSRFETSELLLLAASDQLFLYYPVSYQDIEPSVWGSVDPWKKETIGYFILPPQIAADLGKAGRCRVDRFIVPEEIRKTPEMLNLFMVLAQKDKGRNDKKRAEFIKAVEIYERQVIRMMKSLSILNEEGRSSINKWASEDVTSRIMNIFSAAQKDRKKVEDEKHWYLEPRTKKINGMWWIKGEESIEVNVNDVIVSSEYICQNKRKLRLSLANIKGEWYFPPPDEWLKKQEWSTLSAMKLFAGIDPHRSPDPNWARYEKKWKLASMEALGANLEGSNYKLMSNEELREELHIMLRNAVKMQSEILRVSGQTYTIDQCSNPEEYDSCNRLLGTYEDSENRLNLFIEGWMEFKGHSIFEFDKIWKENLPPAVFLKWVVEKRLIGNIPWWNEAIEDGLIDSTTDKEVGSLTDLNTALYKDVADIQREESDKNEHFNNQDDLGKRVPGWELISKYLEEGLGKPVSISTAKNLLKGRRYKGKSVKQGGNEPGGVWAWSKALDSVIKKPVGTSRTKKKK